MPLKQQKHLCLTPLRAKALRRRAAVLISCSTRGHLDLLVPSH